MRLDSMDRNRRDDNRNAIVPMRNENMYSNDPYYNNNNYNNNYMDRDIDYQNRSPYSPYHNQRRSGDAYNSQQNRSPPYVVCFIVFFDIN